MQILLSDLFCVVSDTKNMCFFWVSSSIVTPRTCYKRFFSHFNEVHLVFCRPLIKFASIWLGAENAGDNFDFFRVLIFLHFSVWNRSECLLSASFHPEPMEKRVMNFRLSRHPNEWQWSERKIEDSSVPRSIFSYFSRDSAGSDPFSSSSRMSKLSKIKRRIWRRSEFSQHLEKW